MVTVDDIGTLITSQVAATTGFLTTIPGDCVWDRSADTPTAYPYSVFTIQSSPPDLCFGDVYIHRFQVAIAAYAPPEDVTGITTQAVQAMLFTAFGTDAASIAMMQTSLRNATERVMHAKPLPETGLYQQQLREGRDIFMSGITFEIQVQGDRSVS